MLEPPPGRPLHTRQHPRYEVSFPVECSTRQFFFSNHVSNIGKGGLFLRSDRPLPLNEEVSLVLHLPGTQKSIFAAGRVVWNHDAENASHRVLGSGIRFVGMTASDRAALESYLGGLTPARTRPPLPR
jgi:type IV pilus assembly protein PilZ